MNVLWETMVDEMRAARLELDNRRHFTEERKPIELARDVLAKWTEPYVPENPEILAAKNAMSLRRAASHDLIEMG
jgi:hypothetical protein